MIMEHRWKDNGRENRRIQRENRSGATCPPHIHGIAWDRAPAFEVRGPRLTEPCNDLKPFW